MDVKDTIPRPRCIGETTAVVRRNLLARIPFWVPILTVCPSPMRTTMPVAVRISAAGLLVGGLLVVSTGCSDQAIGRPADQAAIPPDNPPPAIDPAKLA